MSEITTHRNIRIINKSQQNDASLTSYMSIICRLTFKFACKFVVPLLLLIDNDYDYDYKGILRWYLIGYSLAMATIIGQMLMAYSLTDFANLNIRFGDVRGFFGERAERMMVSYNQNELGVLCVIAATICVLFLKKNKKLRYFALFLISSMIGFMTQSRAFVIAFLAMAALYFLFSCTTFEKTLKNLAYLVTGSTVIIGSAACVIPAYMASLIKRFQEADITNGRNLIMKNYFSKMFGFTDGFIFGVGIQDYSGFYCMYDSAHNSTQETMIAWGVIGLIAVCIFLCISLLSIRKQHKISLIQYVPIFVLLLISQSGQGFSNSYFALCLMVSYAAVGMNINDKSLEINELNRYAFNEANK